LTGIIVRIGIRTMRRKQDGDVFAPSQVKGRLARIVASMDVGATSEEGGCRPARSRKMKRRVAGQSPGMRGGAMLDPAL
jgi:hypothetical protein